jgi:cell division protein FtsN
MEQQKALWIIFSVAAFFMIVILAGLFWLKPADKSPAANEIKRPAVTAESFDPIEYTRTSDKPLGLVEETKPAETVQNINISGELIVGIKPVEGNAAAAGTSPAVIEIAPPPVKESVKTAAPVQTAVKPEVKTAVTEKPKTAVAAEVKKPVTVTEYWIQAGSYSNQDRAGQAKDTLTQKGFPARISTVDVNGQTMFRVRTGSYANKAEADKFLQWIKEVKGFEASYISEVKVVK